MKQWYEELFTNYSKNYDNEGFTKGTTGECNFIEAEIGSNKSIKILDVGCGTGRHDIELAKRGYTNITGIDLSDDQLKRAREKAEKAEVEIDFIKADARDFHFDDEFDAVLMICEGAFSLMETDEMNFQILQSIEKSLKPGGKLIFTCLNALFPLFNDTKEFLNNEGLKLEDSSFDLMTFRDKQTFENKHDDGSVKTYTSNERFYAPSEITWMLKSLNFSIVEIFGCDIGDWNRSKKLGPNNFEMLVVAEK
jgi:ubiquinone/menaquinone biosynthesis C-methylase UbiE